jgi:putative flippase GtrA
VRSQRKNKLSLKRLWQIPGFTGIVGGMLTKYHKPLKFLMSGGLAAFTEYTSFLVLHHFGVVLVLANALSFCCGLVISFMLNKHWVFSRKGDGPKQFMMYATLALINLVISSGLIVLLVHNLNIPPFISKVCTMALIASWNFFIFQKIIFKDRPPA